MDNFNSQTFKIEDASSYDNVTDQFDYFTERLSHSLASRLISLAEIGQSERVLDLGTGTGVVACKAAKEIDSGAVIYAVDLSEKMLSKAREKAALMELEQKVKFIQMDAEMCGFEEQRFDVVLSLFALLHFPNPLAALKEIYRVLRPGGKLIIAFGSGAPLFSLSGWIHLVKRFPDLWQNLRGNQLTAPHFLDSLVKQYIPRKAAPEESNLAGHTNHNRSETIVSLVKKSGFDIVKTDWHGHQQLIDTPEEFWEIQRTFSSIARKRLSTATAIEINTVYKVFIEGCREVQSRGGHLVYPFGAFYIVANRPVK